MVLDVSDIERERKRLESAGVKFEGKIEEIPGIVRIATFRDPLRQPAATGPGADVTVIAQSGAMRGPRRFRFSM